MDAEENGNLTIYQQILESKASLETIVEEWLEFYKIDRSNALLSLLQVFIDSSGCKGKLTEVCNDYVAVIKNLTNDFKEDSSEYPLCQSGKKWKRFKTSFCDFIAHLIRGCQNSFIYDGYMLCNIISLLVGLSDSQVRAFRHSSTLSSMKLITHLVEVLREVSYRLSLSKTQYENETNKASHRRNAARIEHLSSVIDERSENIESLNEMIEFLFKAVFINRFRDVVPAIREVCISEIGLWMRKAPDMFLNDLHLKYIGWSLSDKVSSVRLKAIQALIPMYEIKKLTEKLELFTHKFKGRLVSMTRDIENSVAVETIKLIGVISNGFDFILIDKDIEEIYKLVYSSETDVARGAGELLSMHLQWKTKNSINLEQNILSQNNMNTFYIKNLLKFHIDCGFHKHASYLVDSLIDNCEPVKDWKCMTDLLLGLDKEIPPLSLQEEKYLIDIMVCSLVQVCARNPPPGRQFKKIQSFKMLKANRDHIQKMSMHFITVLPDLLDKYSSDGVALGSLLEIPEHFDLSPLAFFPSLTESLEILLSKVQKIVNTYHNADILEKCCKILEFMCENNYRIAIKAETFKKNIIDEIVNKFRSLLIEQSQIINEIDEDLKYSLTDTILKISVFYSEFDLVNWNLWEDLFNFLNDVTKIAKNISEDCTKHCISSCYFSLFWELKNFKDSEGKTSPCNITSLIKSRFMPYIGLLKKYIAHSVSKKCSEESYLIFCDLLIIMRKCFQALGVNFLPMGNNQKMLEAFVEKRVFLEHQIHEHGFEIETTVEDLYKRRVMLSSYCKLFISGILPVYFSSHLLKHYVESYSSFGDIIALTVLEIKNTDNADCARAIIGSLIMLFEENSKELVIEKSMYKMMNLSVVKELAKQLSQLVVSSGTKETVFLHTIHKEGIIFALRNSNIDAVGIQETSYHILFFEVLIEFIYKMCKTIVHHVLNFLNGKVPLKSKLTCQHQPLLSYRNALLKRA